MSTWRKKNKKKKQNSLIQFQSKNKMISIEKNEDAFSDNAEFFIQCFNKKIICGEQKLVCKFCSEIEKNYAAKSSAIRHLKTSHSETYNNIKQKKIQKEECETPKEIELRVKVNVSDIWDCVIELVAFNSLSLNSLESPVFQKIIKPYAVALEMKGIRLHVTAETAKRKIEERATAIQQRIKDETKNKFVCLMIDIASRHNRSVLGVNVGFVLNDAIAVRTISMHTLRISHTANEIFQIIKLKLKKFDIEMNKIIAFTTDNGRNLTKTAALFDEMEKNAHNEAMLNYQHLLDNFDSDEEMDEEIFDQQYYTDLLEAVRSEFEMTTETRKFVHGVRCGLHCLHLAIIHAIDKTPAIKDLLKIVRNLVKKLRTTKYRNILKEKKLHVPILDVVTRWNTIFEMVLPCCHS